MQVGGKQYGVDQITSMYINTCRLPRYQITEFCSYNLAVMLMCFRELFWFSAVARREEAKLMRSRVHADLKHVK